MSEEEKIEAEMKELEHQEKILAKQEELQEKRTEIYNKKQRIAELAQHRRSKTPMGKLLGSIKNGMQNAVNKPKETTEKKKGFNLLDEFNPEKNNNQKKENNPFQFRY